MRRYKYLSVLIAICFTLNSLSVIPSSTMTVDALRPLASSVRIQALEEGLAAIPQPKFKPIRVSESGEESHYWYLYHRLHELNRRMVAWFPKMRREQVIETIRRERIRLALNDIDEILPQIGTELDEGAEFEALSAANKRLDQATAKSLALIEEKYLESLRSIKDRARFARLNAELDALNAQQTTDVMRRSVIQLLLAKEFLMGIKKATATARQKPNINAAMACIIGARENMERITIELYWRQARQYISAFGRKTIDEITAEGIFGEEQQTQSLGDWDINVLERGKVRVRMLQWKSIATAGGKRLVRPVWADVVYDDIVTAARAQINIMVSQNLEVMRIYSNLAHLRYVVKRIEQYKANELPDSVKEAVLPGLEFFFKWVHRGRVDPKKLGSSDISSAIISIQNGNVSEAIDMMMGAREKMLRRVEEIRNEIRVRVYKRWVALNAERKALVEKDRDIKEQLGLVREILDLESGVFDSSIYNLNAENIDEAKSVLASVIAKHFAVVSSSANTPRAKAKRKIEATIAILGQQLLDMIQERQKAKTQLADLTDTVLEEEQSRNMIAYMQQRIRDAEALSRDISEILDAIPQSQQTLRELIPELPDAFKEQMQNIIDSLEPLLQAKSLPDLARLLDNVAKALKSFLNENRVINHQYSVIYRQQTRIETLKDSAGRSSDQFQHFYPPTTANAPKKAREFLTGQYRDLAEAAIKRSQQIIALQATIKNTNTKIGELLCSVLDNVSTDSASGISATITIGLPDSDSGKTSSAGTVGFGDMTGLDEHLWKEGMDTQLMGFFDSLRSRSGISQDRALTEAEVDTAQFELPAMLQEVRYLRQRLSFFLVKAVTDVRIQEAYGPSTPEQERQDIEEDTRLRLQRLKIYFLDWQDPAASQAQGEPAAARSSLFRVGEKYAVSHFSEENMSIYINYNFIRDNMIDGEDVLLTLMIYTALRLLGYEDAIAQKYYRGKGRQLRFMFYLAKYQDRARRYDYEQRRRQFIESLNLDKVMRIIGAFKAARTYYMNAHPYSYRKAYQRLVAEMVPEGGLRRLLADIVTAEEQLTWLLAEVVDEITDAPHERAFLHSILTRKLLPKDARGDYIFKDGAGEKVGRRQSNLLYAALLTPDPEGNPETFVSMLCDRNSSRYIGDIFDEESQRNLILRYAMMTGMEQEYLDRLSSIPRGPRGRDDIRAILWKVGYDIYDLPYSSESVAAMERARIEAMYPQMNRDLPDVGVLRQVDEMPPADGEPKTVELQPMMDTGPVAEAGALDLGDDEDTPTVEPIRSAEVTLGDVLHARDADIKLQIAWLIDYYTSQGKREQTIESFGRVLRVNIEEPWRPSADIAHQIVEIAGLHGITNSLWGPVNGMFESIIKKVRPTEDIDTGATVTMPLDVPEAIPVQLGLFDTHKAVKRISAAA